MKTVRNVLQVSLMLAAGLVAVSATAQQEQWLEYHTSSEPRGYRWLELSTNPPPGVALPQLQPGALFGRWTNGLDASGGRWLCLDRPSRTGPFNRMFFDGNGNGRLDDKSPISVNRRESGASAFGPVKVVFKGEDGPISYHLIFQSYNYSGERSRLLVGSAGWYEGTVTMAGKKRRLQLFDNNVNGAFNDRSVEPSECDRLEVTGDRGVSRYLGRYLELDGQLLRIEVARDGAFIKVQKAEGVKFGSVRVPETIAEFKAVGECGDFTRKPVNGEFTLPVGKYRVNGWTINRKDEKGASWTLTGSGFPRAADFEVAETGTATVQVGEPIRLVLQAGESRSQVAFNLRILGTLGESVDMMRENARPRPPQLHVASLAGSFRSTNTFEYG